MISEFCSVGISRFNASFDDKSGGTVQWLFFNKIFLMIKYSIKPSVHCTSRLDM